MGGKFFSLKVGLGFGSRTMALKGRDGWCLTIIYIDTTSWVSGGGVRALGGGPVGGVGEFYKKYGGRGPS